MDAYTSEKLWSKDYLLILLAVVFASFTHNAFTVVFPVYILDIGGTNELTGLMMSGLTVAGLVTRLIFGNLIDVWGRKKTLLLGSSLFALNTFAYLFVSSLPGLFILRIFNGISQGIFFPVPPTIVADVSPRSRLVDGMGFFGAASSLAFAVTPTIGLWLYRNYGHNALFLVSTITAVISVFFGSLITDHYQPEKEESTDQKVQFRLPKISTVLEFSIFIPSLVALFAMLGNSSVTNFLAVGGLERGITNISLFFMVNNVTMIITRLLVGRASRKFGINTLLSTGILLSVIGTAIIAFSFNISFMLIAAVLLGIGFTIIIQLLQVKILDHVSDNRRGVANSTFMLFNDIGTGAGASLWGSVSTHFGYIWTYLLSALTFLISWMIYKFDLKKSMD